MPKHLVILQNGFNGSVMGMNPTKNYLEANLDPNQFTVVISTVNSFYKTWDGIGQAGTRLADFVISYIECMQYDRISFIGHSLGGLFIRYCIGILNEIGYFDIIKPVLLVTVVTPHLGIGLSSTLRRWLAPYVGLTGKELTLTDGGEDKIPLLQVMTDPNECYGQGLAKFSTLLIYGNVKGDGSVALSSACLCDNYDNQDSSEFPLGELIELFVHKHEERREVHNFDSQTQVIYDKLQGYPWIRKVINLSNYWDCHNAILNKSYTPQTEVLHDIVEYLRRPVNCEKTYLGFRYV